MDRFEVVDMTCDETDPRFKVWDGDNSCYLPGYWATEEDAIAGAYAFFEKTDEQ